MSTSRLPLTSKLHIIFITSSQNAFVTLKILSGQATILNRECKLRELEALQRISYPPESASPHCIPLLDTFYHQGIEEDGEHLCIVTELQHSTIQAIRQSVSNGFIPTPIIKRMLRHVLLGLAHMHERGVAHTGLSNLSHCVQSKTLILTALPDLKPDNIMANLPRSWSTAIIEDWVKENPPITYPPERSLTKMVIAFVSRDFKPLPIDDFASHTFKIADLSSGKHP